MSRQTVSNTTLTLNGPPGRRALEVNLSGATGANTTVGGGVYVDNTAATGAGVIVYSNQGATAGGRLLVVKVANTANPQAALRIENAGTNAAISVLHTGTSTSASALDVTSQDRTTSAIGFKGVETGKGSIKITHDHPSAANSNTGSDATASDDASASILRLSFTDTAGTGTACQGIYMYSEDGSVTSGVLVHIANGPNDASHLRLELSAGGILAAQAAGGGIATRVKAGAPVDGDYVAGELVTGIIVYDSTNSKLWVRHASGTWKGVVVA